MKLYDKLKLFFKKHHRNEVETIIISEKQCPHCVSRRMFDFDPTPKSENNKSESSEFHK